jgi:hypothetical protein
MFVIDLFYRKVVDRREEGSMNPMAKTIKYIRLECAILPDQIVVWLFINNIES